MRIDLTTGATISGSNVERATVDRTPSLPSAAPNATLANNSDFSESDTSVSTLATVALNAPEGRAEKVQAIQSQLRSGSYRVSPAQLAESIMGQMRLQGS